MYICIEKTTVGLDDVPTPHCRRQDIGLREKRYITPQCGNTFIAGGNLDGWDGWLEGEALKAS